MEFLRFLRTVSHLKPVQIYGRVLYRLHSPSPRLGSAPPLRDRHETWVVSTAREASLLGPTHVRFLNVEGEIAAAAQWNDPARDKLWLYNLHYFDDLNAGDRNIDWQRALIARWIAENPPGFGNGWEPYPVSLRIANWIKWALAGHALEPGWCDSLAVQARWLEDRIEWHLQGNHLLANAKALVFAGLFFEGEEAGRWLTKGLSILQAQLPEQILADGGHFERTPMYHAIILEDLLDLINLSRAYGGVDAAADWQVAAGRMRAWLAAMTHGDGGIGFFNDAAFKIAATLAQLEDYALRLGLGPAAREPTRLLHLRASGYLRLAMGDAVVLADAAPVGPDYLPGHAHADTLSFEFSLGGERVVVNGGTSVYGTGPQRQFERSTAAHSTVEVDAENSSEVWGGFRVGRRARIRDLNAVERSSEIVVSAAHDGYRRLGRYRLHRRGWVLGGSALTVTDDVEGSISSAVARFHLGPAIEIGLDGGNRSGSLVLPSGRRIAWKTSAEARIEPSQWHPEFGISIATKQLFVPLADHRLQTVFSW
jgi:uncharacterized heparinase superfamily protein